MAPASRRPPRPPWPLPAQGTRNLLLLGPGPPLEPCGFIAVCAGSSQVSPSGISGGQSPPLPGLPVSPAGLRGPAHTGRAPRGWWKLSPENTVSAGAGGPGQSGPLSPMPLAPPHAQQPFLPPQSPRQAEGHCPPSRAARGQIPNLPCHRPELNQHLGRKATPRPGQGRDLPGCRWPRQIPALRPLGCLWPAWCPACPRKEALRPERGGGLPKVAQPE